MTVLLGDIGGTNARFALRTEGGGIDRVETLAVADHAGLAEAATAYLAMQGVKVDRAVIAVAISRAALPGKMPNADWMIDEAALAAALGLRELGLLNDFEAQAHAVATCGPGDLQMIQGLAADCAKAGVASVIGAGTGLGTAILDRRGAWPTVVAAEGGHVGLAPHDAFEDRLLTRLRGTFGRVSVERTVSGAGLRAIAETHLEGQGEALPESDVELWSVVLSGELSDSERILDRYLALLGGVAGDLALAHGAGALFLSGGLPARIGLERLAASSFAERFRDKGRYSDILARMPVALVSIAEPGLEGCAVVAAR